MMECYAAAKKHAFYYFRVGVPIKLKSMSPSILAF